MNSKKEAKKMDEMQKLQLMKLEEHSFWIIFWTLCAIVVGQALMGAGFREIAGELAALLIAGGCVTVLCLKNGLWSVSYQPSRKTNVVFSAGAALALGAVYALRAFLVLRKPASLELAWGIVLPMAAVFAVCFVLLEVLRGVYKRRRDQLDDVEEHKE